MRTLLFFVAVVVSFVPSQSFAQSANVGKPADGKRPPNILVILSDDQRGDLMGCAGHPILRTPNMDRIARAGMRFKNAFVTTPICAASRASILAGVHERTHKFTFSTPPLAAEFCAVTYPAILRQAGYRTGLIGKFGIGVAKGQQAEMFDTLVNLSWPFQKKLPNGETRHIDQIATDKALEFLRDGDRSRPFCLSVSFHSPHAHDGKIEDLYPSPKTVEGMYEKVAIPEPPLADAKHFEALPEFLQVALNKVRWHWQFDTPEKYAKNVRAYYRMISGIDHEIGRLLAELETLGVADNTIVIFLSDNGYFLNERGLSGKWVHFEESLRVPLIIADPRLPMSRRGQTSNRVALNIDLAPTILELVGKTPSPKHQGRSLVPILRGDDPADWRTDFFGEHLFAHPNIPKWEGVRGERYVYARYFEQKPPFEFLHDLKTDPRQIENLATDPAMAEVLATMRARCDQLRDQYGGPYSPERFPTISKKKAKK